MSTLEDAQAFLKFIIATRLRPQSSQPVPQAAPGEAGTAPAETEAQSTVPATVPTTVPTTGHITVSTVPATGHRPNPSPREDTPTACRAGNGWPPAVGAVHLHPPLEATRPLQAPPEKAAAAPGGGLGPHVITNLFLYPIKSCAAFEVRVLMAEQRVLLVLFIMWVFLGQSAEKSTEYEKTCRKSHSTCQLGG